MCGAKGGLVVATPRSGFRPARFFGPWKPRRRRWRKVLVEWNDGNASRFAALRALVPMSQQKIRKGGEHEVYRYAGRRDQQQRREHPRNIELKTRFYDAKGESSAVSS